MLVTPAFGEQINQYAEDWGVPEQVQESDVGAVATFPDGSHEAILYPVALTASSDNPDAAAFLDFLKSDDARPAFEQQGFAIVAPAS